MNVRTILKNIQKGRTEQCICPLAPCNPCSTELISH